MDISWLVKPDFKFFIDFDFPFTRNSVERCQTDCKVQTFPNFNFHCEGQRQRDFSSFSSVELSTFKKRKRHKRRTKKSKIHDQLYKDRHLREQNILRHNNRPGRKERLNVYKSNENQLGWDQDCETISIDSLEGTDEDKKSYFIEDIPNDNRQTYLNREELRFALARATKREYRLGSLKERLQKEKMFTCVATKEKQYGMPASADAAENTVSGEISECSSLEEQELRLIALKSAVMKKHFARKKRNAELPYSPTDFAEMLKTTVYCDDNMDLVEEELEDNEAGMEISPLVSPKLLLSPDYDFHGLSTNSTVDTKLVDMDIVNSESEDELKSDRWPMIEHIPLPTETVKTKVNILKSITATQNTPSSPATSMDGYIKVAPPARLCSLIIKQRENGDRNQCISKFNNENKRKYSEHSDGQIKNNGNTVANDLIMPHNNLKIDPDSDEEEHALRALLLSKFLVTKNSKKPGMRPVVNKSFPISHISSAEPEDSKSLPILLYTKNPTESILKEALRRLKMKPNFKNSITLGRDDINSHEHISHQLLNPSPLNSPYFSKKTEPIANNLRSCPFLVKKIENANNKFAAKFCKEDYDSEFRKINEKVPRNFKKEYIVSDDKNDENKRNVSAKITEETLFSFPHSFEANEEKSVADNVMNFRVDKELTAKTHKHIQINKNEMECVNKLSMHRKYNVSKSYKNEDIQRNSIPSSQPNISGVTKKHVTPIDTGTELSGQLQNTDYSKISSYIIGKHKKKEPLPVTALQQNMSNKRKSLIVEHLQNRLDVSNTLHTIKPNNIFSRTNLFKLKAISTSKLFLRPTKLIKPNKIINKNVELIQKSCEDIYVKQKLVKRSNTELMPLSDTSTACSKSAVRSRLITSIDLKTIQVKKMVITLHASDTESSDDDGFQDDTSVETARLSQSSLKLPESLAFNISNCYYDNKSPISLTMDSPSHTPKRTNSPSSQITKSVEVSETKLSMNTLFEEKLDDFLKNMRSKVQIHHKANVENELRFPVHRSNTQSGEQFITPLAVHHLPEASQNEYRKLQHRMRILEKQKKTRTERLSTICGKIDHKNSNTKKLGKSNGIPNENTLFKKGFLKNGRNNTVHSINVDKKTITNSTHQPAKTNLLQTYENIYLKIGSSVISNLNNSLQLVEKAKIIKIAKIQYEQRLKELRAELTEVECRCKEEQQKMSTIYPEICRSNELVISFKQKRAKLFKAAINLGKSLRGEKYRLNNEFKQEILLKSKKLATQIKLVNSINYSDLQKLHDSTKIRASGIDFMVPLSSDTSLPYNSNIRINILQETNDDTKKEIMESRSTPHSDAIIKSGSITFSKEFIKEEKMHKCQQTFNSTGIRASESNAAIEDYDETCIYEAHGNEEQRHKEMCSPLEEAKEELWEYKSPLENLRNNESQFDPNGVICPYDLVGGCEDNLCTFTHLLAN